MQGGKGICCEKFCGMYAGFFLFIVACVIINQIRKSNIIMCENSWRYCNETITRHSDRSFADYCRF